MANYCIVGVSFDFLGLMGVTQQWDFVSKATVKKLDMFATSVVVITQSERNVKSKEIQTRKRLRDMATQTGSTRLYLNSFLRRLACSLDACFEAGWESHKEA